MSPTANTLLALLAFGAILAIAAYTAHVSGTRGRVIALWVLLFMCLGPLALLVLAVVRGRRYPGAPWRRGLVLPAADSHLRKAS